MISLTTFRFLVRLTLSLMILGTLLMGVMITEVHAEIPMVSPEIAVEKCMKLMSERKAGYNTTDERALADAQLCKKLNVLVIYMEKHPNDPINDIDNNIGTLGVNCKEYLDQIEREGEFFTSTDLKIEFFYASSVDYRNRKVSPVNALYVGTDTKEDIKKSLAKDFNITYDMDNNALHLYRNGSTEEATLTDLFYKFRNEDVTLLYKESPDVWVMKATIIVEPGMRLIIENPKPTTYLWLKLANCGSSPSRIIVKGELIMDAVRVSSWDSVAETFLVDATAPRAEIKYDGGSGVIQHCRLEHLGYASSTRQTHGITILNSEDVKIYDNIIIEGFQGINIQHSHDVILRGNVIENPFDTGILLENRSYDCDILSNIVSGSGRHGIMIFDNCRKSSILSNTLHDNFGHGIKVFKDCKNLDISENIAKNNTRKGIAVFACKDLQINKNIIINGTGIVVSHKSKNCTISNNRFENTTVAIGLIGVENDLITVGEAINVAYEEFEIYSEYNIVNQMYGDVTKCTISDNDIRLCSKEGIKLVRAHHNTIRRNTILNAERYGIILIGSWFNQLSDNEMTGVKKAKYCATEHSYENILIKKGEEYILTDRGCTITSVDINRDGCINILELDDLGRYLMERITWWFS